MYLKRITVTGFKSFAAKTVLDLEPGIVAIVGPNGSGKSNIADAIRWALGEQNKSRLRLTDREEVVFAGTDKRARASFAEVVLLFDNQSGAFPLDLTEVEISRRLYRSGESEYRLGGRIARLADIQTLMAEAGFGAGTYAVIGQGMIDSFLLSSPSERKLLFDEAAGIRGSELKREASLRQLNATSTNLTRLRDIAGELAPRLKSLEQGMAATKAVESLKIALDTARLNYIATFDRKLGEESLAVTRTIDELTLELHRLKSEISVAELWQRDQLKAAETYREQQAAARAKITELEADQQSLALDLGRLTAEARVAGQSAELGKELTRQLALLKREGAKAKTGHHELIDDLSNNNAAAKEADKALKRASIAVAGAQSELLELRESLNDGSGQRYVGHALQLLKTIAQGLNDEQLELEQLRLLVHKAGRMLSHATKTGEDELLVRLKASQVMLEAAMTRRETATEHQNNITITRRSLELDEAHLRGLLLRHDQEIGSLEASVAAADASRKEATELGIRAKETADQLAALQTALAGVHALADGSDSDRETATHIAEEAARLERGRGRLHAVTERLVLFQARSIEVKASGTRLRERMRAWGLDSRAGYVSPEAVSTLEQTVTKLEYELEARQAQVRDTAAEYSEVQTRHSELTVQITDLEEARANLDLLIAELDKVIRTRFKENFASLSDHFTSFFTRLFEGGTAALEIEEGIDGEYGILIKASPKGKRLTNLNALSGGERAMAGVALLAAILSVNPSPFVVLDEIDAALDEANSGRLALILEELQGQSQLIVITHNRQTMRSAKALFGVTMDEHHVSRLLSLRLEEATTLAAR
jgi:chromosome segregation ATPase